MKVDKQTFDAITDDLRQAFSRIGFNPIELLRYRKENLDRTLSKVWRWVHEHKSLPDGSELFESAGRAFDHDPDHELYPCGTNHHTMKTVLRDAFFVVANEIADEMVKEEAA